jgi:hypothetical protein
VDKFRQASAAPLGQAFEMTTKLRGNGIDAPGIYPRPYLQPVMLAAIDRASKVAFVKPRDMVT